MGELTGKTVSVVVLNYNGKEYLDACLESLNAQTYAADLLEIVVVDNGSSDGSVDHIKTKWKDARLIALPNNVGFAEGVNVGARNASGEILGLLNNDARAHPDWIQSGVKVLSKSSDIGAAASKILSEDGNTIDFAGGALSFYGHGFKLGAEEKDIGQFDNSRDLLFASGAGMFVPRELFLEVGGFDPDFFAFFEDVDFGWRLWVLGYRVVFVPESVVYHRHHGTIEKLGYPRERFLLERNALLTITKNYEDQTLQRVLPAALWLTVERGFRFSENDVRSYDLSLGLPSPPSSESVSSLFMAHIAAIEAAGRLLPAMRSRRKEIQARRRRTDREIAHLFRLAFLPNDSRKEFTQLFFELIRMLDIEPTFMPGTRILIVTGDTISRKMAGPAIRAWEMAGHLSLKHEVKLLARYLRDVPAGKFSVELLSKSALREATEWADVVIFQGFILHLYPELAENARVLVADIYDPFHLENLEVLSDSSDPISQRMAIAASDLNVINQQLTSCDFFICASEKQRDFWLGQLAALGRVNLLTYEKDPTMRRLVEVVPFGIPEDPPIHNHDVIREVTPSIGPDDKIMLWGGGVYNWFDPITVINAVAQVSSDHPELKLFFMGMSHPNPDVPQMRMASEALQLARALGLEGKHVFFNMDWVPYEERANYLLEADVGVSAHLRHVETTFSYRTRVLDYFWAGLPVIVTRGDAISELVESRGLGLTVEPGDIEGFANAIIRFLDDEALIRECKLNIDKLRPDLTWPKVLAPLEAFCETPTRASDRLMGNSHTVVGEANRFPRRSLRWGTRRALYYLRRGGLRSVWAQYRIYRQRQA